MPSKKVLGSNIAGDAFTLTPHATNEMPAHRWFITSSGGAMTFRAVNGAADVTFTALAGVMYPISMKFLRATTVATGFIGFN